MANEVRFYTTPSINDERTGFFIILENSVYAAEPTALTKVEVCLSFSGIGDSNPVIDYQDSGLTSFNGQFIPVEFHISAQDQTKLRENTTDTAEKTIYWVCRYKYRGSTYYSQSQGKLTIINADPTVSLSVQDGNDITVQLTGDNQKFVKGFSNASYTITAAGQKYATITSRKITCGSKSATTASGTLTGVDSATFETEVTDTRGNTTKTTVSKTLVNYVPVTCNCTANKGSSATSMTITVNGNYFNQSFGNQQNTLTVQYRYRQTGGSWGNWTSISNPTKSGNTYTATVTVSNLTANKSYEAEARATDKLMTASSSGGQSGSTPAWDTNGNDLRCNVPFSAPSMNVSGLAAVGSLTVNGQSLVTPVDYVTSKGTSYGWEYIHWNSGKYEMFARKSITFSSWSESGGHYRSVQNVALPFSIPYAKRIAMSGSAGSVGTYAFVNSANEQSSTNAIEIIAYSEAANPGSITMNMSLYVAGYLS